MGHSWPPLWTPPARSGRRCSYPSWRRSCPPSARASGRPRSFSSWSLCPPSCRSPAEAQRKRGRAADFKKRWGLTCFLLQRNQGNMTSSHASCSRQSCSFCFSNTSYTHSTCVRASFPWSSTIFSPCYRCCSEAEHTGDQVRKITLSDSVSIKLSSKQTKCPTFCSDDASFYSCYSCLWILGVLSGPAGLVLLLNLKTNPTFCILVTQRINRHRLFPSCDESGKPSGL